MAFVEKTIESEIVFEGKVFNIERDTVNAVNGQTAIRDIVRHSGGAVIVAITDQGKLLLERQFRKSVDKVIIELPAGKIDNGEQPQMTALRELKEETGYSAGEIEHLTTITTSPGYSDEYLHIYFCRELEQGENNFDPTESLDVFEVDPDEAVQMVLSGEIDDAKSVAGILYARAVGKI